MNEYHVDRTSMRGQSIFKVVRPQDFEHTPYVSLQMPTEIAERLASLATAMEGIDDPARFVENVNVLRDAARGFMDRVSSASDKAVFSREALEIVMKSVDEIGDALSTLPPKGTT